MGFKAFVKLEEALQKAIFDFIVGRCVREIEADFEDEYDEDNGSRNSFFQRSFEEQWEMVTVDDVNEDHDLKQMIDAQNLDDAVIKKYIDSIKAKVKAEVKKELNDNGTL